MKEGTMFVYKYPRKIHNEAFVKKLIKFILHELSTKIYDNQSTKTNTFYINMVDGRVEFVDRNSYKEMESLSNKPNGTGWTRGFRD